MYQVSGFFFHICGKIAKFDRFSPDLIKRVQKLQNFAAKICIGGAQRRDHATPFITQLNWLKMDNKVISDVAPNVNVNDKM